MTRRTYDWRDILVSCFIFALLLLLLVFAISTSTPPYHLQEVIWLTRSGT